ncbi:hypothetical protein [Colwellia piezophila]|uniref:hypothetical protein n=1 Tax=Colwellia piezophila TaxID=211668 RepID=UPI000365B7A4|nr:hypothetical protein [Colwellia piezophila]
MFYDTKNNSKISDCLYKMLYYNNEIKVLTGINILSETEEKFSKVEKLVEPQFNNADELVSELLKRL